jgi:hypothetical protein
MDWFRRRKKVRYRPPNVGLTVPVAQDCSLEDFSGHRQPHNHSTEGDQAKNGGCGVNSDNPDLPFRNIEFSWRDVDGGTIFGLIGGERP